MELDDWHMQRALELAFRGQGFVEPNPMVGCVIARGAEIIGEGWHRRYGGPHAEIEALRIAGSRAAGATLYVTLEPCCHRGKTPPCTEAILAAALGRVVVAQLDPFPEVAGKGIAQLRAAGIAVEVGPGEADAKRLNAPYLKLLETGRPWVLAKWAMTLDGKLATRTGESRWISGPQSREVVHRLRGRMDAVIVGRGTADRDDPLLAARPARPRIASRIVLDTGASLALDSQLVRTAAEVPVLVASAETAPPPNRQRLAEAGCEVLVLPGKDHAERLDALLVELGRRGMTNVLFEGGAQVLGVLLDSRAIDEVHVFIAPKLLGGADAPGPVAGRGLAAMADAWLLPSPAIETLGADVYVHGKPDTGAALATGGCGN